MPGAHFPDPIPTRMTLTHFLFLKADCPPSPGAQRQSLSLRLGGRTPRFLLLHPTPMPQFLWSPRKEGMLFSLPLPPGERKERKCGACWEALGGQVLS